ncbi:ftsJ-like methyltransferase domain-containing protein [Phthorimaea operculella]|nr:ftsJ-like methyltransferase domain-containing protein [Phthorimaea operculella]
MNTVGLGVDCGGSGSGGTGDRDNNILAFQSSSEVIHPDNGGGTDSSTTVVTAPLAATPRSNMPFRKRKRLEIMPATAADIQIVTTASGEPVLKMLQTASSSSSSAEAVALAEKQTTVPNFAMTAVTTLQESNSSFKYTLDYWNGAEYGGNNWAELLAEENDEMEYYLRHPVENHSKHCQTLSMKQFMQTNPELGKMLVKLARRNPDLMEIEPQLYKELAATVSGLGGSSKHKGFDAAAASATAAANTRDVDSSLDREMIGTIPYLPLSTPVVLMNLKIKLYRLKDAKSEDIKRRNWQQGYTTKLVQIEKCINRCYLKLAELDYLFNFELSTDLDLFVDLCAGPGGFTEYLNSKSWRTFGYAFQHPSIKVKQDKIPNTAAMMFFTGNILDPVDRARFVESVGRVASLVTADGAVDCRNRENHQEECNFEIIRAEVDVALQCLKPGGKLVLKVFDMYLDQTKMLMYEIYNRFERFHIVKPMVMSRSFKAERYVVAFGFKSSSPLDISTTPPPETTSDRYRLFECFLDAHSLKLAIKQMDALLNLETPDVIANYLQLYQFYNRLQCKRTRMPASVLAVNTISLVNMEKKKVDHPPQAQAPPLPTTAPPAIPPPPTGPAPLVAPQAPAPPLEYAVTNRTMVHHPGSRGHNGVTVGAVSRSVLCGGGVVVDEIIVPSNYCIGFVHTVKNTLVNVFWVPVKSMLLASKNGGDARVSKYIRNVSDQKITMNLLEKTNCKVRFLMPAQSLSFCTFTWLDKCTLDQVTVHDLKWVHYEDVSLKTYAERQKIIREIKALYSSCQINFDEPPGASEAVGGDNNGGGSSSLAPSTTNSPNSLPPPQTEPELVKITRLINGNFTKCTGLFYVKQVCATIGKK